MVYPITCSGHFMPSNVQLTEVLENSARIVLNPDGRLQVTATFRLPSTSSSNFYIDLINLNDVGHKLDFNKYNYEVVIFRGWSLEDSSGVTKAEGPLEYASTTTNGDKLYRFVDGHRALSSLGSGWFNCLVTVTKKNSEPKVTLTSPVANQTLHENSVLNLAGNTTDNDTDDVVTIKYQIDSGTVRNLHSAVSNGVDPIAFTKELKYEGGMLKDGNTAITSTLDKDLPHTVSIWAEDQKGGKSAIVTRTFFVVPNRPPQITLDPIATQTDLINSNVINVSGVVTDLDKNDVTVTFSINGGEEQQVYQGPPSAFTFNVLLADLKVGANTVIIKATDTYNTSGAKTLTINKAHNAVPVNKAVARYEIVAPTGTARSVLLWVTRTLGNLNIDASISLTNANEAENYVDLAPTNTGVVNGLREDEFAYQGTADKEKIILKITYNRTDANVIDTIKQISGVLF